MEKSIDKEVEEQIYRMTEWDEVDLQDWIKFEPILAGLKVHNRIGIFFTVCLIWRRIIMLFVAMFLDDHAWAQVLIFLLSSLFMLCFIGYFYPFIKQSANKMELFNELMIMACGALAIAYVGIVRDAGEGEHVGEFMSWIIRI